MTADCYASRTKSSTERKLPSSLAPQLPSSIPNQISPPRHITSRSSSVTADIRPDPTATSKENRQGPQKQTNKNKTMSTRPIAHLVGTDPVSNKKFLPEFPLTDKFWEHASTEEYQRLHCARLIASLPIEDSHSVSEESLQKLEFVLSTANPWGWDDEENFFPDDRPSYNVALRLLKAIASAQPIWFGAVPEANASDVWKFFKPLPKEEAELKGLNFDELIYPEDVRVVTTGKSEVIPVTEEFLESITIHDGFSIQIGDKHYTLDPQTPFVACILAPDDMCWLRHDPFDVIMNPAFKALCLSNPTLAKERYDDAISDYYHYKKQDSENSEVTWRDFKEEHPSDITDVFNDRVAKEKTLKKCAKEMHGIARQLIGSQVPSLIPILRRSEDKLHIKTFRLEKTGIQLDATLETTHAVHKILIHPKTGTQHEETPRIRKPKNE